MKNQVREKVIIKVEVAFAEPCVMSLGQGF
jgi:hypothetical protein